MTERRGRDLHVCMYSEEFIMAVHFNAEISVRQREQAHYLKCLMHKSAPQSYPCIGCSRCRSSCLCLSVLSASCDIISE